MPIMMMGEITTDFIVGDESAMLDQAMVISSSSPVLIPQLQLPISKNERYIMRSTLYYRSYDLASGVGFSMNGPLGFEYLKYQIIVDDSEGEKRSDVIESYDTIFQGVGVAEVGKLYSGVIYLCLKNGPNDGYLTPWVNVEIDMTTALVDMGSHSYLRRIN